MTLMTAIGLVSLGVIVGAISGMLGIGGAIMIIPALVFVYHFTQQQANGTSLAILLPPIAAFAVLEYHRKGFVNWPYAFAVMAGFVVGAPIGAKLVTSGWISERLLRWLFGFFLVYVAARQLFRPGTTARGGLYTFLMMAGFAIAWFGSRMLGRKLEKSPYWPRVYRKQMARPVEHDYEI